MKKRKLGKTDEMVTEVSLGAMNLRMLDKKEEGISLIKKALDLGINLIDTARAYNGTTKDKTFVESEVLVKEALKDYKKLDEPIVIVSKGHGYTRKDFIDELKTSREKLGIEGKGSLYIGKQPIKFVYFFHGISKERWESIIEDNVLEYAKELQEEGYINYLGFSSHNGHEEYIEEAINSSYFQVVELPYNVFNPGLEDLIKLAYDKGIGVINMKAFGGTQMITQANLFEEYCDISTKNRLKFCLALPQIATVDVGCRYIEELKEDVEISNQPIISKEECISLVNQAKIVADTTKNTCRECRHCLEKFECPQKVPFVEILTLNTKYHLAVRFNKDIKHLKESYAKLEDDANLCTNCGECKPWCEYKLDIPKLIEETKKVLA